MSTNSSIPFNLTEEAFLLYSIHEVMKVWASKSGNANMNISVQNGMVDLQLGFQLGPPGDHHLPPQPQNLPIYPRYKTPERKAKDRARAAAHQQAQQLLKTSSPKESPMSPLTITPSYPSLCCNATNPFLLENKAVSAFQPQNPETPPRTSLNQAAPASLPLQQADSASFYHKAVQTSPQQEAAPASFHQPIAPHLLLSDQAAPARPTHPQQQVAAPAPLPDQIQASYIAQANPPLKETQPQVNPAVSAPPPTEHPQDSKETTRKINIVYNKADQITMSFACNHKIAYSDCQHDIEDKFWKVIREKPLEFLDNNERFDDTKVRETYKSIARSLGVRIY